MSEADDVLIDLAMLGVRNRVEDRGAAVVARKYVGTELDEKFEGRQSVAADRILQGHVAVGVAGADELGVDGEHVANQPVVIGLDRREELAPADQLSFFASSPLGNEVEVGDQTM